MRSVRPDGACRQQTEEPLQVLSEPGGMSRPHHIDRVEAGTLAARQPPPSARRPRGRYDSSRQDRPPISVRVELLLMTMRRTFKATVLPENYCCARSGTVVLCSARSSDGPTDRARFRAVTIRPTWLKACGKLPSMWPVTGSYSSDRRPTSFLRERNLSKSSTASARLPIRQKTSASQKLHARKAPSRPLRPSGTWSVSYRSRRPLRIN